MQEEHISNQDDKLVDEHTTGVCNAWPVQCHIYGYRISGQYQIMLLGDQRHMHTNEQLVQGVVKVEPKTS